MSLLSDLTTLVETLDIPVETGVFSDTAPDRYLVLVPLSDTFAVHADNSPGIDVQEVRISLYTKGSYTKEKNALIKLLLSHDFTVTGRSHIGYETETGYHHYNVDVAHYYEMED